jgi:hypothetical protein
MRKNVSRFFLLKNISRSISGNICASAEKHRMKEILMSLICPQCSQANQESTVFCRTCGYRFQGNEKEAGEDATLRQINLAGLPADADPSDTLRPGLSPVAQPTPVMITPQPQAQGASGGPAYGSPAATSSPAQPQGQFFSQPLAPAQGAYAPQQPQPVYGQYPPQGSYGAPAPQPRPATSSTLQRGFAGKGTPVRHQSWLFESKQVPPQTLQGAFIANLQKQGVMGVTVEPERLREQGVVMEERDYVEVRYGASSIFVYLAPMGQNLYVSRTSTIQQPYSRVRTAVAITLAVLMLISLLLYAVISPTPGFTAALNLFFSYAFFGLLFFFIIALLRSLVFLFTDNDFLAMLRPNRLSDFSLDALSSIEQTTDKALRVTLQDAGLDVESIKPQQSTPQQILHRF